MLKSPKSIFPNKFIADERWTSYLHFSGELEVVRGR